MHEDEVPDYEKELTLLNKQKWIQVEGLVATIKDRIKDLGDKYKAILVDGKTITTEELVLQAGIKAYEEVLVLLVEKEKKEEHSSLCRVMHNLYPESWEKKEKQP